MSPSKSYRNAGIVECRLLPACRSVVSGTGPSQGSLLAALSALLGSQVTLFCFLECLWVPRNTHAPLLEASQHMPGALGGWQAASALTHAQASVLGSHCAHSRICGLPVSAPSWPGSWPPLWVSSLPRPRLLIALLLHQYLFHKAQKCIFILKGPRIILFFPSVILRQYSHCKGMAAGMQ